MDIRVIADKEPKEVVFKDCKRCATKGRESRHAETEFSLKKNGKRHSYCKRCRAEDTMEYQKARREARVEYVRNYRASRRNQRAFQGNVYKRRENKPVLQLTSDGAIASAIEIGINESGELSAMPKFKHLYFSFSCAAVKMTIKK